jgi:hypothetical protein
VIVALSLGVRCFWTQLALFELTCCWAVHLRRRAGQAFSSLDPVVESIRIVPVFGLPPDWDVQ